MFDCRYWCIVGWYHQIYDVILLNRAVYINVISDNMRMLFLNIVTGFSRHKDFRLKLWRHCLKMVM